MQTNDLLIFLLIPTTSTNPSLSLTVKLVSKFISYTRSVFNIILIKINEDPVKKVVIMIARGPWRSAYRSVVVIVAVHLTQPVLFLPASIPPLIARHLHVNAPVSQGLARCRTQKGPKSDR